MRLLPAGAPRLGLGLAALGRPGYITLNRGADLADRSVEAMRARAEEVLDAAYAGGLRWFDCARSYGLSEDFVGKWLEKRHMEYTEFMVCIQRVIAAAIIAEKRREKEEA